jgi:hypothetical protein
LELSARVSSLVDIQKSGEVRTHGCAMSLSKSNSCQIVTSSDEDTSSDLSTTGLGLGIKFIYGV